MQISNYREALCNLGRDYQAGTGITRLTGDETCSLYIVEIGEGAVLPAHYHREGIEIYQILAGEGVMTLGLWQEGVVVWGDKAVVKASDCFSIPAGTVHSLANTGSGKIHLLCSTPPAHLGEDRYFIEG